MSLSLTSFNSVIFLTPRRDIGGFLYIEKILVSFFQHLEDISTNVHLNAHDRQTIGLLDAYFNNDVFINNITIIKSNKVLDFSFLKHICHIVGWYLFDLISMLSCNVTCIHVVLQLKSFRNLNLRNKLI